jgi:hypothetical protein
VIIRHILVYVLQNKELSNPYPPHHELAVELRLPPVGESQREGL